MKKKLPGVPRHPMWGYTTETAEPAKNGRTAPYLDLFNRLPYPEGPPPRGYTYDSEHQTSAEGDSFSH